MPYHQAAVRVIRERADQRRWTLLLPAQVALMKTAIIALVAAAVVLPAVVYFILGMVL